MTDFFDESAVGDEAAVLYGDGEFSITRPGTFVVCAVTGTRIALHNLKYWNVDRQEPYVDATAAMRGFGYVDT